MCNTIFVIIKYLLKFSLNKTFLLRLEIFPAITPPNKGAKKSIINVGKTAPFVPYNTIIVQIISNSVNTINADPYLNKKELCVVSILLTPSIFLIILYLNVFIYFS